MRKTRYPSSDDALEIHAMRGDKAPRFSILGDDQEPATDDLHELALLINQLRKDLGRDPIQAEIIKKAKDAGLGGKDRIRPMLDEGNAEYWRAEHKRKTVNYAPVNG
jgi:hypothetical protein